MMQGYDGRLGRLVAYVVGGLGGHSALLLSVGKITLGVAFCGVSDELTAQTHLNFLGH